MAHYKSDIVDINLETGNIHRSFLNHSIGQKDDDADRFGIRAFRDGVPQDLSGASCQAWFLNSQGTTIALTSYGTVSGNVAYVTLPPACYDYDGQFTLAIKIVGGGVTSTVRIIDGVVDNINVGGAVTPTSAVPTYSEILAQYDAMVAATSAANTAIAETFNAATAYPAGKYVINDGALYLLTSDHAANVTWANTSKVAVKLGNEVGDLKSALANSNDGYESFDAADFVLGQIEGASEGTYYKDRIKFENIHTSGNELTIFRTASGYSASFVIYDSEGTYVYQTAYIDYYVLDKNTKYRIVIKNNAHTDADHNTVANIGDMATKLFYKNTVSVSIDDGYKGKIETSLNDYSMEMGIINSSGNNDDDEYNKVRKMRTVGYIFVNKGDIVSVNDSSLRVIVFHYGMDKTYVSHTEWITDSFEITEDEYIRMQYGLTNDNQLNDYLKSTQRSKITITGNARNISENNSLVINALEKFRENTNDGQQITRDFNSFQHEFGTLNSDGSKSESEYNKYRKVRSYAPQWLNKGDTIKTTKSALRMMIVSTKAYGIASHINSGWVSTTPFTVEYSGYYMLQFGLTNDAVIPEENVNEYSKYIIIISSILNGDAQGYEYIEELIPPVREYSYNGEQLDLNKYTYGFAELNDLPATPSSEGAIAREASAYYNGILFKFYAGGVVQLINYTDSTVIATLTSGTGHSNCAAFSNVFDSSGDEFPLCYVGDSNDYDDINLIRVIKITRESVTLKQTIRIPASVGGYYSSNFGLDVDNNMLWTTGYKLQNYQSAEGNNIYLCQWNLDEMTNNGDGTVTPAFIAKTDLPFIDTTQDEKLFNGHLYIVSSNPYASSSKPTKLYVISLDGKRISNIFTDFWLRIKEIETEGIVFVDRGNKYVIGLDTVMGKRVEMLL